MPRRLVVRLVVRLGVRLVMQRKLAQMPAKILSALLFPVCSKTFTPQSGRLRKCGTILRKKGDSSREFQRVVSALHQDFPFSRILKPSPPSNT